MNTPPDIVIYHNPECGTSRNALAMIRNAGLEPHVIEYLKTPPARALLASLIGRMGVPVRSVLREKGTPFAELGLADPGLTDESAPGRHDGPPDPDQPAHRGVARSASSLCRPSEAVLDLLPEPQRGAFAKEDGEPVVDAVG